MASAARALQDGGAAASLHSQVSQDGCSMMDELRDS